MKVFSAFLLLTAYGTAQQAGQQATPGPADPNSVLRVETKVVLVDAVVTDNKGNYVHDLTQKDFKVFEDNKEQPIQSLSFEADPASPRSKEPRYMVLYFDTSTMEFGDQVYARKAAASFIDANAGPNRQIAIVNYSGTLQIAQNFTSDAERLKAIVAKMKLGVGPSANNLGDKRDRVGGNLAKSNLLLGIRELAKNLASIPGRKTLVLLTAGFAITPDEMPDLTAATAMCNHSNVAIYPIDVRGLVGKRGASLNQELLRRLADPTSGFVILDTNDLLGGLEKIGKEMNEFYLIGYRPPVTADGRDPCHLIRVKVDRSGTTVRSRNGYCNAKAKDLLAQTPVEKTLESRVAATQAGNIAATMLAPYFFIGTNAARVNVAIEIPSESFKFEKEKGRLRSTIDILGIAYKEDGSVSARFSDALKVDFETQKEVDAFQQRPYHYENQLDVGSGKYSLKVAISAGGENFSKLEQPLVVDAYDLKTFSVSPVVLSTRFDKVGQLALNRESASLEDRTPLIAAGYEVTPLGSARFKGTDKAIMYFEVYEPVFLEAEPKLALGLQIRVFDAKGALKVDSGGFRIPVPEKGGNPTIPYAMQVPVAKLGPGAYKVQVIAVDSLNHKFARTANFEVQ